MIMLSNTEGAKHWIHPLKVWLPCVFLSFVFFSLTACSLAPNRERGAYDRESGAYSLGASPGGSDAAAWRDFVQTGEISYYANAFEGKKTASGARYAGAALSGAHRELPFGTRVKVTNLANGRSVVVAINDRGPFTKGRIMDVSRSAAVQLGLMGSGVAKARIEVAAN